MECIPYSPTIRTQRGYRMKDRKSQQGSDKPKKTLEEVKRKKGHMALRNNVWTMRVELWKELRPVEMCVLDIIIDRTIGWRCDEAVIKMEEFMERSGQKHPHIYKALKTLEDMGVIKRRKDQHRIIYGLREDYFGGLLIKRHEDALQARKSKIKIVVDNSKLNGNKYENGTKPLYENGTNLVRNSSRLCTESVQTLYENGTRNHIQVTEIINETPSLKTLLQDIYIKKDLKDSEKKEQNEESFTHLVGAGTGKKKPQQLADPEAELQRQLKDFREMEEKERTSKAM